MMFESSGESGLPYAKKVIMQSNGPKHAQIGGFRTIYFA
jgi:hypothetical protein